MVRYWFETPPPSAISFKPFHLLKNLGLKSVGLGLESVSFHSGRELVEWIPKSIDLGVNSVEILDICDEVEEKELEVFGPQIELDLGEGSSIHDLGEPSVEAAREPPTVVEILDEPSQEGMAVEERAGTEPVHEDVEMRIGDMPAHKAKTGDSCFEDYPGDDFEKVGEITPEKLHNHPLTLFLRFRRRKPLPALNQGGTGSRPWLGKRIYHGSGS